VEGASDRFRRNESRLFVLEMLVPARRTTLAHCSIQGDHSPGKPGKVRESKMVREKSGEVKYAEI